MSRISKASIDRIFETARIEEVIGEFIQLKKAGSNFKGLSPFSNEKTPSFMVSPVKQIFKDFSSGKGGNVVSFLMDHEHFTYPEALRWLANKYGIEIEEDEQTPEQQQKANERESLFGVGLFAQKYFTQILKEDDEGRNIGLSYFRERGFKEETIEKFLLGYSPEKRDAFTHYALDKGYSKELLEKAGLTITKNNFSFDRFAGRVIFPIHSMSGRVLGFGGRTLRSDKKVAKYLNSPETEIYHKSRILYGIYQSKTEISRQDHCYLVEGYTDVISFYQAGIKNVVASSGTALTVEQINLVKRLTPNLTILYDGDEAGIKASFRGIDLILEQGMNVRVVLFPEGEDPDSFARKKHPDELIEFLEKNKQDFVSFKTEILSRDTQNDPIKKAGIVKEIVRSIAHIPDGITRDVYVRECSRIMDIEEHVLFSELEQIRSKHLRDAQKREVSQRLHKVEPEKENVVDLKSAAKASLHYDQERALIWLLLNHGMEVVENREAAENTEEDENRDSHVASLIISDLVENGLDFENPQFHSIFEEYLHALNEKQEILPGSYFARHENQEVTRMASDLMSEKYELADWERRQVFIAPKTSKLDKYVYEAILRFKVVKAEQIIHSMQEGLKAESTPEEKTGLLRDIKTYVEFRNELNLLLNRVV